MKMIGFEEVELALAKSINSLNMRMEDAKLLVKEMPEIGTFFKMGIVEHMHNTQINNLRSSVVAFSEFIKEMQPTESELSELSYLFIEFMKALTDPPEHITNARQFVQALRSCEKLSERCNEIKQQFKQAKQKVYLRKLKDLFDDFPDDLSLIATPIAFADTAVSLVNRLLKEYDTEDDGLTNAVISAVHALESRMIDNDTSPENMIQSRTRALCDTCITCKRLIEKKVKQRELTDMFQDHFEHPIKQ